MQRSRISCRPMFGTTRRRSVTTTGRSDRVESFRPLCYHAYRLWASEPVFWMSNGDHGVAPLRAFRCQYDAHRTAAISAEHSDTYMSTFTRLALDPSGTQMFLRPAELPYSRPLLALTIAALSRCTRDPRAPQVGARESSCIGRQNNCANVITASELLCGGNSLLRLSNAVIDFGPSGVLLVTISGLSQYRWLTAFTVRRRLRRRPPTVLRAVDRLSPRRNSQQLTPQTSVYRP
jgi:hypothetical protein